MARSAIPPRLRGQLEAAFDTPHNKRLQPAALGAIVKRRG